MSTSRARGFTIVELLIVIVVIAILASISTTTFAGMQTRALNTARAADGRKMKALIDQYVTINGAQALRSTLTSTITCVGAGFEDLDPGAGVSCNAYVDGESGEVYINPHFYMSSNALDSALSTLGSYSLSGVKASQYTDEWGTEKSSAPQLIIGENHVYRVDGQIPFLLLVYFLDGENTDCQMGGVLRSTPYSGGVINLYTNNSDNYTSTYAGQTWCMLNITRG